MGEQERGLVIVETPHYLRALKKLPGNIQHLARTRILLFTEYPTHAGLRVHKLGGHYSEEWALSVNYSYRIIFRWSGNHALLVDIGKHDIYE